MKVVIRTQKPDGKYKTQEATVLQLEDGSYRVRNYGYTDTLAGMLVRIISRHANTNITINFVIDKFTLSLIYESEPDTVLCGFTFVLLYDDVDQLASLEAESVHYQFAMREIRTMADRWFRWATYSLLARQDHYCDTSMLQWDKVTDIASWQDWVWNSEQRGSLAHLHSLEDAWEREQDILIPKLEALIQEARNEQRTQFAQTA